MRDCTYKPKRHSQMIQGYILSSTCPRQFPLPFQYLFLHSVPRSLVCKLCHHKKTRRDWEYLYILIFTKDIVPQKRSSCPNSEQNQ